MVRRLTVPLFVAAALLVAVGVAAPKNEGVAGPAGRNMRVVGHLALGAERFNGDVWAHEGRAYVGDWDFSRAAQEIFCRDGPNDGVAVVDVRRPSRLRLLARLRTPQGTWAEDVAVFTARYGPLAGHDVAIAGVQVCGGSPRIPTFFRGLILWDVTNPGQPTELGRLDVGCCPFGVHALEIRHRTDLRRTFVYATVPRSDREDLLGGGDFRLVDVTDPTQPTERSSWALPGASSGPPLLTRGCLRVLIAHAAEPSPNGKLVFLSYWDAGFVALDVTDPARPVFRGRTRYSRGAEGNAHSASYDSRRKLLFGADEDFCSRGGYGYLRIYDYFRLAAPRQIGSFRTPNSRGRSSRTGTYTIHNPLVVDGGRRLYAGWFSDGVRLLDVSNPRRPREIAYFVPPRARPPKPVPAGLLVGSPQVWGVALDRATPGVVYASDMFSGLWILKPT